MAETRARDTADVVSAMVMVVDNQTDANYPRPTGVGAVYWIGSAEPVNAAAYDMWWSG